MRVATSPMAVVGGLGFYTRCRGSFRFYRPEALGSEIPEP